MFEEGLNFGNRQNQIDKLKKEKSKNKLKDKYAYLEMDVKDVAKEKIPNSYIHTVLSNRNLKNSFLKKNKKGKMTEEESPSQSKMKPKKSIKGNPFLNQNKAMNKKLQETMYSQKTQFGETLDFVYNNQENWDKNKQINPIHLKSLSNQGIEKCDTIRKKITQICNLEDASNINSKQNEKRPHTTTSPVPFTHRSRVQSQRSLRLDSQKNTNFLPTSQSPVFFRINSKTADISPRNTNYLLDHNLSSRRDLQQSSRNLLKLTPRPQMFYLQSTWNNLLQC